MSDGYVIKLVRDHVSEVDASEGIAYRPVKTRDEHLDLLRKKLGEEVIELIVSSRLEEYADVYQALKDLAVLEGLAWDQVRYAAEQKALERGTFKEGTVRITTEPEERSVGLDG